ncbi:hypothetical protein PHLCEN_2v1225 [Hermanssonia centrifuga]|uniref:Helitron helicase-like domain-containing protein n=1 Tax=Hermanssonia centrifuga TaxID=98765 RepID=A0A2R6S3R7_9APHY|nr:hypothetical protein PHLCEN_2v1225 [Hermanssonia centrifuga]
MANIMADHLKLAVEEEAQGLSPSDPAVCLLRKHVQATAGHIVGTDHSQYWLHIKATEYQVKTEPSIFGKVAVYFGTMEAQGHGTLHLHMLIWLKDTLTPAELLELLKSDLFRDKMKTFIKANMCAYCPALESVESFKAICSDQAVGFTRPPPIRIPRLTPRM